jgi:hypothetical protein
VVRPMAAVATISSTRAQSTPHMPRNEHRLVMAWRRQDIGLSKCTQHRKNFLLLLRMLRMLT